MIETVLVLPTPQALLPPTSRLDPVAELRAACDEAVSALLPGSPRSVVVLAAPVGPANQQRGITDPLGFRVARHLLAHHVAAGSVEVAEHVALPYAAAALLETSEPTTLLVMADGSARRGEKAPGHLDPRATGFDEEIARALRTGDAETLAALDPTLGAELWCEGVPGFRVLGEVARGREVSAEMSYDDAPFGVAWWVARWKI